MARAPLSDVFLHGRLLERIRRDGTCTVNTPDGNLATVYASATGSSITNPVNFIASRGALDGWVEAGEYALVAGGKTQYVEVNAGDNSSSGGLLSSLIDPSVAAMNFNYVQINSVAATTTSQLAKYVRVVPQARLTAAKIVSMSGAAAATITTTKVALYSSDGTTLTRLAISTTNTGSGLWDTANTRYAQALNPATTVLNPGQAYYVGMLVNATTPGAHQGYVKVTNVVDPTLTEVPVPMYTKAAQTDLATSEAISGLTAAYNLIPWVAITA